MESVDGPTGGIQEVRRQQVADTRAGWSGLLVFELLFKLVYLAVFAPLAAWLLRTILQWSGDQVVSNHDLIAFFLSLPGVVFVAVWATAGFAVLFFELGGLTLLAIGSRRGQVVSAVRMLRELAGHLPGLLALGMRQFLVVGTLVAFVLAVAAATRVTLLGDGDIYFYLTVRPPQFWWAVVIVAVVACMAGIVIVSLLLRWIFAVPVLLLTGKAPQTAMADSRRLVHDYGLRPLGTRLTAWAAMMIGLQILAGLAHATLGWALMSVAGERVQMVIAMSAALFAFDVLLAFVLGIVAAISFAFVIARLYVGLRPDDQLPASLLCQDTPDQGRIPVPRIATVVCGAAVMLGMSAFSAGSMIGQIRLDEHIQVTAHRGSARLAPENTLAAILQAIEDGADFAEIDVQETADGGVVLLHDEDICTAWPASAMASGSSPLKS